MNCTHCYSLPEHLRRCDVGHWPECEGRICISGMPKHQDPVNLEKERREQTETYRANLRAAGWPI